MAIFSCYYLVLAICCALFCGQLVILWIDYNEGKTAIGSMSQDNAFKLLLCLTFCPLPAFKTENYSQLQLMTSPEYFLNATYGTDDIFSDDMVQGLYYIARKH